MSTLKWAKMLGIASLGVGLIEIVATEWLEETMGVDHHHTLIRAFGLREIASGMTILSQPGVNTTLANGLWSRVAGDAADLAVLAAAVPSTRNPKGLAAVLGSVIAITAMDVVVAAKAQQEITQAKLTTQRTRVKGPEVEAMPNGPARMGASEGATVGTDGSAVRHPAPPPSVDSTIQTGSGA